MGLFAEFDPTATWVGGVLFCAFFGAIPLVSFIDRKRRFTSLDAYIVAFNLTFIPYFVYLTLWCYDHATRIDTDPEAYSYDMRLYWPFCAIMEGILIALLIRSIFFRWSARAVRLFKQADGLRAEGKIKEAEAASAKAHRIIQNAEKKCK